MNRHDEASPGSADVPLVSEVPFGPHTFAALCALATSLGLNAALIDLEGCVDESELFERIASALAFPDWFGANWDALFDCLNDLSWLPARGYVLVFEHTGGLADEAPQVLHALRELLIESAVAWRERGVTFRAVLSASDGGDRAD